MTRIHFDIDDELSKRRHESSPEIVLEMANKILKLCILSKLSGKDNLAGYLSPIGNVLILYNLEVTGITHEDLVNLRKHYELSPRITIFVRKNGRRINKDNGVNGVVIPCIVQLRFTPGRADQNVFVYEFTCHASQRGMSVARLTRSPKSR